MSTRESRASAAEARHAVVASPPSRRESRLVRYLGVMSVWSHTGSETRSARVRVCDVMTRRVATVRRETPFREIVDTLVRERVDAVPVIDDERRVVGFVSESDLLARAATRAYAERHVDVACDMMRMPVVTVQATATVAEAARRAARERVRRMPVVDDHDRLIGIVSRVDLLRVSLDE